MPYIIQTWEDYPSTKTMVTKATLDHQEQGIYDAMNLAEKAIPKPIGEGTEGQVLATNGDGETYWKDEEGGGTEVVANPSDIATDELNKLKVGDKTYSVPSGGGGGTNVVANPAEQGTTDLNSIKIDDTVYNIPTGKGSATQDGLYYSESENLFSIKHNDKYTPLKTSTLALIPLVPTIVSASDVNYGNIVYSSEYGTNDGGRWTPFSTSNYNWSAKSGIEGQYLGYNFGTPVKIDAIGMRGRTDSYSNESIKTFYVQYSDDGVDWINASELLELENPKSSEMEIIDSDITETNAHQYWRIYAMTNCGDGNRVAIGKLQFYSESETTDWLPIGNVLTREEVQEMIDEAIKKIING